jgi:hypothetical protein
MPTETELTRALSEGRKTGDYYQFRVLVGIPADRKFAIIKTEWHDREVNGRTVKRCTPVNSVYSYHSEKPHIEPQSSICVYYHSCRYCVHSAKWICLETGEILKV